MASYKDAGVDIDAGNESVRRIKTHVKKTFNKNVITNIGAFGGAFSIKEASKMKNPVLVSTIDGVGTKLKVASMMNKWDTVGEDIVNHCSDDILGLGAKPLFFLDYLASDKILPENVEAIVSGMAKACAELDCALIGGETAEMPGVYVKGEHDIAGCMVGLVDKEKMVDGSLIKENDILIGLASNGLHTNGYSLARKIFFEDAKLKINDIPNGFDCTVGEELLKVHKSYSKNILLLAKKIKIKGIAHITGGGLIENVPRIMPSNLKAEFDYSTIPKQPVFDFMQKAGNIPESEMYRVFNMGVGLVVCISSKDADAAIKFLKGKNESAWVIGKVKKV